MTATMRKVSSQERRRRPKTRQRFPGTRKKIRLVHVPMRRIASMVSPYSPDTEQLSRPVDGRRTDPAVIGVYVDVAAAHDGGYVPAGEAVTVFEDRRDAERGRRFDDEASVVEEHPHAGDDRRLLDQDGVVSDQEEVVQDGRDGTPAGDAVSD